MDSFALIVHKSNESRAIRGIESGYRILMFQNFNPVAILEFIPFPPRPRITLKKKRTLTF